MLSVTGTYQDPPERQHRLAAAVPQGSPATDLQASHAAIVPAHTQALPRSRRVVQALGQTGQPLALVTGSPPRARLASGGAS